jgi:hypothetical protein
MSELADTVSEAIERAAEGGEQDVGETSEGPRRHPPRWTLNAIVAISVAITATFTALCNVKKGNVVQAMSRAQASGVDAWAYYQAKGTKLNIAESALDGLRIARETTPGLAPEGRALIDRKLGEYADKIHRYDLEKSEIKRTAEGFQTTYDRLDERVDQFDLAEALTSIAVALFGITALTQKKRLLYLAWFFAGVGIVMGIAGFLSLPLHPSFLTRSAG